MGTLVTFPEPVRGPRATEANGNRREPATVIILPVVRIERYGEEPDTEVEPASRARSGRRRRRRASRS
jgi:hypothetical protein